MYDYDKLYTVVDEYLTRNEIEDTEEVISAYTLWNLIQKDINKLQYVLFDNTLELEKINKKYKDAFLIGYPIYDEALENLGVHKPWFRAFQFKDMKGTAIGETGEITLYAAGRKNLDKSITICRDFNDKDYYGNNINIFLTNCINLDDIFTELCFYSEIKKAIEEDATNIKETEEKDKKKVKEVQIIKNDVLSIEISYPIHIKDGCRLKMLLNEDIDKNESQFKKYVNYTETIQNMMIRKQNSILKRTPINVADLNNACTIIVERNMNAIKYKNVKEYVKK